jgi:succinoglycan biosynthesis transport protein ExoP
VIDDNEHEKSLQDYMGILKRRKLSLLLPAVFIFLVAVALAFGLPATYESKAIILIEEQEIPKDFVRSTISSFAAQQVQVISQRVLTVQNIGTIVEKFKLYQQDDSNSRLPSTELAIMFRENMTLDLVSADVIDPRSGRPTEATIAFTLAFSDASAGVTQKITSELVTLFLNENLRERSDQAASTEKFLSSEVVLLNQELLALEQLLADFKTENEGSLPELYQFNLSTLERTQREISDVKQRVQELDKRKIELAAQLTQLSPSSPVVLPSGEVVLSDVDRLKALQSEYRRKAAVYRSNHPDVVRLNREINALQQQLGVETDVNELRRQLQEQNLRLADLRSRYKDSYHEVQTTQAVIADLEKAIRVAGSKPATTANAPEADNPAYILLQTQLDASRSEMTALANKQLELQAKIAHYEGMIKRAPNVEKDYQALLRDYNNATAKYQDVKAKQREAAMSKNLEQKRKGERFTLIEPPALPLDPISPNRPAIIFLGLVLAAGAGLGFALLREAMDGAIQGTRELAAIMGEAPLVVIPYIENTDDLQRHRRVWRVSLAAGLTGGVLFVLYLHFFFKPLDVLYFVILNNLGLS